MSQFLLFSLGALLFLSCALEAASHGDHEHQQIVVADDADWATRHMAEEHHISSFDASTFFMLHDYDSQGLWSASDIHRTYGFADESTKDIPESSKQRVVSEVLSLYDADHSGTITRDEFLAAWDRGVKLPDFGMGPGHHGDDEYEYEIHHWEKYHSGDDVKEEDLNHPEDIEHFRKHDEEDRRREEWERVERAGVVESNIPAKFRVN
ncbi:secretory pathway protein-like protein Ssp120 [Polyplosphaeria fusca]|uniref:Secretory pathway protein-like protein Ssp120 n=1 Tax=Polyplosphaeria fusca TaxID=682080 RepID=A0A9P4R969_9PLEO|nr:secretory pathway protein-like protein Ssp120 [Polyplosphaeria fusca]